MLAGCASTPRATSRPQRLVFLTREGCSNTAVMRANLDEALRALGRSTDYRVVNADVLPTSDPRGGYGTPTVLVNDVDLFGMRVPAVPHSGAT
jgi:hypothetical protein